MPDITVDTIKDNATARFNKIMAAHNDKKYKNKVQLKYNVGKLLIHTRDRLRMVTHKHIGTGFVELYESWGLKRTYMYACINIAKYPRQVLESYGIQQTAAVGGQLGTETCSN